MHIMQFMALFLFSGVHVALLLLAGCGMTISHEQVTADTVETSYHAQSDHYNQHDIPDKPDFPAVYYDDRNDTITSPYESRQHFVEIGAHPFPADRLPMERQVDTSTVDNPAGISLNFQDVDIHEFISVLLGEILQVNYVIDPQVTGNITLHTVQPLDHGELLPLLEQILSMHGAAIIIKENIHKIIPLSSVTHSYHTPVISDTHGGYGIRIVPLNHIAAEEMQKILEPFISEDSELYIDSSRNLLTISGLSQELDAMQKTIELFDVDWLRGMSVGLYPLDHVETHIMAMELEGVLNAMHGSDALTAMQGLLRIVPLERLSSILLIGTTSSALRHAESWLQRLDKPGSTTSRELHVYHLDNAKATELADILDSIFRSELTTQTGQAGSTTPGLDPTEIKTTPDMNTVMKHDNIMRPASGQSGRITNRFGKNTVDIIADETRNALVILATPDDYSMVESAIQKLDVTPLQVLIEASIFEVTLVDDLFYGVEWYFRNSINGNEARSVLDLGTAGLAPLAPAFSYSIIDSVGDIRFVLNALADKTSLNMLSSPSLMVLDNQTAHINVGDEIPVPTRQSISTIDPGAPLVSEIQFRRTGVSLDVTPRVNRSGLVTLEITQEVSNAVSTSSSNIDAPTIQQRAIESTVAVHTGDTIVLGGLIRDSQIHDNSGIPILQEVPILGNLFGRSGHESSRTELLVLLTPRVIRNREDLHSITDEFRRQMQNIKPIDPASSERRN